MSASGPLKDKFLVIEDAVELMAVWKMLFRKSGYEARFCASGSAALTLIQEGYQPNVVMTDYYLPDLTGLELIDKIRETLPLVRCLLVTGNKDDSLIAQVNAKEGVSLLFKPVRLEVLEQKLNSLS